MNIRLDSRSIRIRLSHAEARALAVSGRSHETLAIPEWNVDIRVMAGAPGVRASFDGVLKVEISDKELTRLLTNAETDRPSKADLAGVGVLENPNRSHEAIEIYFEVDRFTVRRD